jgi:hypothetical protein
MCRESRRSPAGSTLRQAYPSGHALSGTPAVAVPRALLPTNSPIMPSKRPAEDSNTYRPGASSGATSTTAGSDAFIRLS